MAWRRDTRWCASDSNIRGACWWRRTTKYCSVLWTTIFKVGRTPSPYQLERDDHLYRVHMLKSMLAHLPYVCLLTKVHFGCVWVRTARWQVNRAYQITLCERLSHTVGIQRIESLNFRSMWQIPIPNPANNQLENRTHKKTKPLAQPYIWRWTKGDLCSKLSCL